MNFASAGFLGLFLPAVLIGFLALRGRHAPTLRQAWLIGASLFFYGVSGLSNLALLVGSIGVNFSAGAALALGRVESRAGRRAVMWGTVGLNLGLLTTFKVESLAERAFSGFLSTPEILIPLALSFITFQQIGFVVACYRRQVRPALFDYLFFVLFFPQLIMGPILRYQEIEPQLRGGALGRPSAANFSVGLAIFVFGLAKKLLLADPLGDPVSRIFDAAAAGGDVTTREAWFAIIGFQFQLFLDFSAYADMAIGLGRMFGINLPINFDEPVKAVDRFDMWRRWHITFVVFMRSHVFLPLIRNWRVPTMLALPLTALLSGLWHGLGWTFVIWAVAQSAIMLALHWRSRRWRRTEPRAGMMLVWAIGATFLITCLMGAVFRAPSIDAAVRIYTSLAGVGGFGAPFLTRLDQAVLLAAALVIWVFPDARRFFARYWTALDPRPDPPRPAPALAITDRIRFRLNARWGVAAGLLLLAALTQLGRAERFIYVQF